MNNRRRWFRALIIFIVAAIMFWQRTAAAELNVYEARALAVMGQDSMAAGEILEEIAGGRGAGLHYLQAEGDIAPAEGLEKIIGVSLSKDHGLLGVFHISEGKQPVLLAWTNTLPLQELRVLPLEKGRNAILIREMLDERFGAYFLSSFYVLYNCQEGGVQEIWRKVIANEQQWNKKWLQRGDGWQGVSEQVETHFSSKDGRLTIRAVSNQTFWSAPEANGPRTTIRSRTLIHTYRWESSWQAVVMAVGSLNKTANLKERRGNKYVDGSRLDAGEQVAVLEDEGLMAWVNPREEEYWRVKTKTNQTGYIIKSCLDI